MGFTPRQAQILELAARGRLDKEIACDLDVSVHTVRSHLQRLYQSEGLANRAEAVAVFVGERSQVFEAEATAATPAGSRPRAIVMGALAGAALALAGPALWTAAGPRLESLAAPPVEHAGASSAAPLSAAPASTARPQHPSVTAIPTAPGPTRAPALPPSPPSLAVPVPAPTSPIQMVAATGQLNLVNQARASAGQPPLSWNQCLAGVAATQARRLAEQGYVSTTDGTTAAAGCHLELTPPAEKLAYWSGASDSQLNSVMVANPADRAELLGPYRYLSAYWAIGPTGVAFLAIELA